MDYKKAYKQALERARQFSEHPLMEDSSNVVEYVFPELRESEDEEMKKELIKFLQECHNIDSGFFSRYCEIPFTQMLAWLERQGEQKSIDKVEPKFHEGDWVVCGGCTTQIKDVYEYGYSNINQGFIPKMCEGEMRLWTIQDAKDGDVLYHKAKNGIEYIVMSKGINENNNIDSYFRYNSINGFGIDIPSVLSAKCDSITPATKEQCDLLFEKMKEAGYEWNYEKKELKKFNIIDEGKAEMDYCFTKMMNGEKVNSVYSEKDEKTWKELIEEVDLVGKLNGFQNFYAHKNGGEFPSAIEIAEHFYELGLKTKRE